MGDQSKLDEDLPASTWDDYARMSILNPLTLVQLVVLCAILINIGLIYAQGGVSRIRDDIRKHAIEAERLKRAQDQDRLNMEWTHGWDEHRQFPADDNYAK